MNQIKKVQTNKMGFIMSSHTYYRTSFLFLFFLCVFSSSYAGAYSDRKLNEGLTGETNANPRFRLNFSGFVSGLETNTRSRSDYWYNIKVKEGAFPVLRNSKDLKIDIQPRVSGGFWWDFLYCLRDPNLSFGLGLELQLNQGRLGSNTSFAGLAIPLKDSLRASLTWSITPQFILGTNLSPENGGSNPANNFVYIKLGPSFGQASIDRSTDIGDFSMVNFRPDTTISITKQSSKGFHDDKSLIGFSYSLGFRRNFYEFLSFFVEFNQTLFSKISTGDTLLVVTDGPDQPLLRGDILPDDRDPLAITVDVRTKQKTNFSSRGFKVGVGFDVLALFCNDRSR